MQIEVTSNAILVFNEISSGGVSGWQVSNHLKESLFLSLSNGEREHPHYLQWLWLIKRDEEMSPYKWFPSVPKTGEVVLQRCVTSGNVNLGNIVQCITHDIPHRVGWYEVVVSASISQVSRKLTNPVVGELRVFSDEVYFASQSLKVHDIYQKLPLYLF